MSLDKQKPPVLRRLLGVHEYQMIKVVAPMMMVKEMMRYQMKILSQPMGSRRSVRANETLLQMLATMSMVDATSRMSKNSFMVSGDIRGPDLI